MKMLLFTHRTIENASDSALQAMSDVIENLLDAHRQRRHLFLPSRAFAQRLSSLNYLSDVQRQTALAILQKRNEYAGLSDILPFRFGVFERNLSGVPAPEAGVLWLPASWLRDGNTLRPFRLVVENSASDGGIVRIVVEMMLAEKDISIAFWDMEVRHGGGAQIDHVLKEVWSEDGAFLAIADSDRRWPWEDLGSTAKVLVKGWDALDTEHSRNYRMRILLDVREIENILPIDFVEYILSETKDHTRRALLTKVHGIRVICPDWPRCSEWEVTAHAYFDIKEGVNLHSVVAPLAYKDFIEEYWKRAPSGRIGGVSERIISILLDEWTKHYRYAAHHKRMCWRMFCESPIHDSARRISQFAFALGIRNPIRV